MRTVEEPGPKGERVALQQLTARPAVLATIGVPLYPLGLPILALQIKETCRMDFGSAWYAASQASNRVIFGVALDSMGRNPGSILFFLPIAMVFALWVRFDTAERSDDAGRSRNERTPKWLAQINVASRILMIVGLVALAIIIFTHITLASTRPVIVVWPLAGGATAVLAMVGVVRRRPHCIVVAESMALMLLGLGVASYLNADLGPPPLPPIALSAKNGNAIGGKFVDRNGGFWCVIGEPGDDFLGLKDDAKVVTIAPRAATPSATRP